MESITNKVVFVTGGSKGIGFGIAEALIRQGAKVAITSRSQESASAAAARLTSLAPGNALGLEADVRDLQSQEQAVQKILAQWGRLDVLVANAGLGYFAPVDTLTEQQWRETIDTNLTGVFFSLKACIPALKKSEGYVITIASLAGTNFFEAGSAYNASKFGLVGFTQAAMLDLRKYGIKVATIMPGSVATEFNDHVPTPQDAWKIQPEDLGQLVVNLLQMNPRTLPSKIEVRPSRPPK